MKRVLLIGGNGFIGSGLQKYLSKEEVYTFDRKRLLHNHYEGDILNKNALRKAIKGKDAIINLVGLTPIKQPKKGYYPLHVQGVKNILSCLDKKQLFIHISSVGASSNSNIEYLKTKGMAEEEIKKRHNKHLLVRPSIVVDKESEVVRKIFKTSITRLFPNIPSKIQPIFREDICEAISLAVKGKVKEKQMNALGPKRYTLFEFAKEIHALKNRKCYKVPFWMFLPLAKVAQALPGTRITQNQINSLSFNMISSKNHAKKYVKLQDVIKALQKKM